MFRSAALLILLAFVLGLWIGLNPDARARAEAALGRADAAAEQVGAQAKVTIDRLFHRVSEESPPASRPPIEPKPSNFLGQLTSAIQQIWEAIKQLWFQLVHDTRRATQT
jgi:hypothetical protein